MNRSTTAGGYGLRAMFRNSRISRGLVWGVLIIAALLAFEVFNYSTTDYAMTDLLGDLRFMNVRWATILALAFCGIDFAGIARLFTPEQGADEPAEVWYLFGAWLLAAAMNAILTWWGVSLAIANHQTLGNSVIPRETLLKVVPIFVAVMVWLIRVLIIGTLSVAGERLFSQADSYQPRKSSGRKAYQPLSRPSRSTNNTQRKRSRPAPSYSPAPKPLSQPQNEPTYHPLGMNSQTSNSEKMTRR